MIQGRYLKDSNRLILNQNLLNNRQYLNNTKFSEIMTKFSEEMAIFSRKITKFSKVNDYSRFYIQGRVHLHFRHMHCWYEKNVNYALFAIAILIIGGAVFFSVKGIIVMKMQKKLDYIHT